jgi:hypothetical protein
MIGLAKPTAFHDGIDLLQRADLPGRSLFPGETEVGPG